MLSISADKVEEITEKKKEKKVTYQFVSAEAIQWESFRKTELTSANRTNRRLYVQSLIEEWLTTGHNLAMLYDDKGIFVNAYSMFQSFKNVCDREFAGQVTAFLETTNVSKKRLASFAGEQPQNKSVKEEYKEFKYVPSLGREAYVTVKHERAIADPMSHWSLRQSKYSEHPHAEYQTWLCRVNPIQRGAGIGIKYDGMGSLEEWARKLYKDQLKVVD